MVVYINDGGVSLLALGLLGILATMFFWFRDVVMEATFQGHHSAPVQIGMCYGMVLFIASEVMFFGAWCWVIFNASLFPPEAIKGVWPPPGVIPFNAWKLPFLNTLIDGDRKHLVEGLGLTVLLGLTFTGLQAYEYGHAAFGFKDGIYSTTFYMATGFHGFHVIVVTIFLIVCFFRARKGHFKPEHHFSFEAAAWYWHFVDVVWLFLFTCIYRWGLGSAISH